VREDVIYSHYVIPNQLALRFLSVELNTKDYTENAMLDDVKLPKTLSKRLEKVAGIARVNPESILKTALKDKLDHLEWKKEPSPKDSPTSITAGW